MKDQVLLGIDHYQNKGKFEFILTVSISTSKYPLLVMMRVLGKSEDTDKLNKLLVCFLVAVHELEYPFALDITNVIS